MNRKILIIGGTRYFGKRLAQLCINNGDLVTIGTRGKIPDDFGNKVKRLQFDRENETQFQNAMKDLSWDLIYDQNCYSASEAESACQVFSGKVGRYIHTSTQSVYIKNEEQFENDFAPFLYPIKLGSRQDFSYGEAKRGAEAVFFQRAKFPLSAVRFPIVLGPDDYTKRMQFHIERIKSQTQLN